MFAQEVAVVAAPAEPPGIFARATADEPMERLTFLMPGFTYLAFQPVRANDAGRKASTGVGLEVSIARWISGGTYLGGVAHLERLDRTRVALGVEGGYQMVGLELSLARDFGAAPQWSAQIGPYASVGMLYISPRYILALNRRSAIDTPGDGAMLVIGLKLPIKIGGR
jgi:hypothetical protein